MAVTCRLKDTNGIFLKSLSFTIDYTQILSILWRVKKLRKSFYFLPVLKYARLQSLVALVANERLGLVEELLGLAMVVDAALALMLDNHGGEFG